LSEKKFLQLFSFFHSIFIYSHSTPNDVTLRTPLPTALFEELHV
jgi:hypothetical protein